MSDLLHSPETGIAPESTSSEPPTPTVMLNQIAGTSDLSAAEKDLIRKAIKLRLGPSANIGAHSPKKDSKRPDWFEPVRLNEAGIDATMYIRKISLEFMEASVNKYTAGVSALVKIEVNTASGVCSHEDIGVGYGTRSVRDVALNAATEDAIIDARRRTLELFGINTNKLNLQSKRKYTGENKYFEKRAKKDNAQK
eukprot:TRINITY_DN9486_c0_g1_i1.p2 TRINITY_DN9486_c0_g1~~TRINITY_DN9486_c0_g1_i1.p2  ORF type:complete len:217 (-),score=42.20 TRINITY_DN9486_c0_g1_i1:28-615(-)